MSEYSNAELRQLDYVEDLLEAYAEGRLTPSGPVLARIRANAMAQATAASALAAAERQSSEAGGLTTARWRLPQLQVPRRAFALGLAATMTLGTSAAVLAAPPGSPFYNARLAIEAALVPTQVDARLAAHEEHLAQLVAAAQAAAASGDPAALEAALAAYAAEVEAALNDVGDDGARLAHLEEVLAKHVAILTALQVEVPDAASIDRAIESSQKAVEKIKEKGSKGGGPPAGAPTGPDNQPSRD